MGLLSKSGRSETIVTGTKILRDAVFSRVAGGGLARIANNVHVATAALDDFARGVGSLPPAALSAIAQELWGGHIEYDPATDLLRSARREPAIPLCAAHPPQWNSADHPPVDATARRLPADRAPPPQSRTRPGWAE